MINRIAIIFIMLLFFFFVIVMYYLVFFFMILQADFCAFCFVRKQKHKSVVLVVEQKTTKTRKTYIILIYKY